jgi:indole-3-glycerol phosphate synthase
MDNILEKIKTYKITDLALRKRQISITQVEENAHEAPPIRGFVKSLERAAASGYALIAEVKKASPSKGLIRADFNPPNLAQAYEQGGASCLSILTDEPSFQGHDSYLVEARAATSLPTLRKDFIFDTYQVVESRALGADCILIIMAFVSDQQAAELESCAFNWGMDVLVEVHDAEELDRALALKSTLLGINNRNLKTFDVTLNTTRNLAKYVPSNKTIVAESGISTPEHLADLAQYGARTFLIGESLMRQKNVIDATKTLLANPNMNGIP